MLDSRIGIVEDFRSRFGAGGILLKMGFLWLVLVVVVAIMDVTGGTGGTRQLNGLEMLVFVGAGALIFALHYLAVRSARAGKTAGRVLAIFLSAFYLLGFPVFTAIGLLLLTQLLSERWQQYV